MTRCFAPLWAHSRWRRLVGQKCVGVAGDYHVRYATKSLSNNLTACRAALLSKPITTLIAAGTGDAGARNKSIPSTMQPTLLPTYSVNNLAANKLML